MARRKPFYERTPELTDTVHSLTRLRNSTNGNPRYDVTFMEDTTRRYVTVSDASFCFGLESLSGKRVDVWLMPSGRIEHMEASK